METEIGTISFKGRKNPLTYSELEKAAIKLVKDSKKTGKCHKFNDTWYSTSKTSPMAGGIFALVENPTPVFFIDKYKQGHNGFLTGFSWMKEIQQVTADVLIADSTGIMSDGYYSCTVRINKLITTQPIIVPKFSI